MSRTINQNGRQATTREKGQSKATSAAVDTSAAVGSGSHHSTLQATAAPTITVRRMPTVSICTVTYNRQKFLPLLQNCIASQTYPHTLIDWIIVDDSDNDEPAFKPDPTLGIRSKLIKLPKKIALGKKRNLSHDYCKGEIIVYMDDDDYYPPQRVSHAVERLLASNTLIAGSSRLPVFFIPEMELWLAGPYGDNHATAGTFAFKRALIHQAHYDETKTFAEEKSFLQNYRLPMAQLDPSQTIICIGHDRNTFEKRKLIAKGSNPRFRRLQDNALTNDPKGVSSLLAPYLSLLDIQHPAKQTSDYGNPNPTNPSKPESTVTLLTFTHGDSSPLLNTYKDILNQIYPRSSMEWIIIDHNNKSSSLAQLGVSSGLKIHHLMTEEEARAEKVYEQIATLCTGDIIVIMSPHCHYPPERVQHAAHQIARNNQPIAGCDHLPLFIIATQELWLASNAKPNYFATATLAFNRDLLKRLVLILLTNQEPFSLTGTSGNHDLIWLDPNQTCLSLSLASGIGSWHQSRNQESQYIFRQFSKQTEDDIKKRLGKVIESYTNTKRHANNSTEKMSPITIHTASPNSHGTSKTTASRIPKKIHIIWIGDDSKCPSESILTWQELNPTYEFRLWGNQDLQSRRWRLQEEITKWLPKEINGAADLMRWEILYNHGGIALDADSICVRTLPDWLLEPEIFAVWENEHARPGLIACGALGATQKHPFINRIIEDIQQDPDIINDRAWKKVGPLRITNTWLESKFTGLTIYPSHYFIPDHFAGLQYSGKGPVFAQQQWGTTKNSYGKL
jgi:mannosyltransferase OCH1-like enzyme